MKKFLFSVATIFAANFAFSQITLQHSFADSETVNSYTKDNSVIYISTTLDNKIKIYNADYSLRKTVNVPIPSNYRLIFGVYDYDGTPFAVSKHIFNTDDKYEFMIESYFYDETNQTTITKLLLINEDGTLIKDFHPNPSSKKYGEYYEVFHDSTTNTNKLLVNNWVNNNYTEQFDVYSLPTSELSSKEINTKNKLSAFPIPTNKTLNVINPGNGANKIEVFDASGKLVLNKNFANSENRISVDVENLPKGIYVYKIGELSSKFIKN